MVNPPRRWTRELLHALFTLFHKALHLTASITPANILEQRVDYQALERVVFWYLQRTTLHMHTLLLRRAIFVDLALA
jgi:hypothetical protein